MSGLTEREATVLRNALDRIMTDAAIADRVRLEARAIDHAAMHDRSYERHLLRGLVMRLIDRAMAPK